MKKIFTLFLGMIIALSAVAAPAKAVKATGKLPAKAELAAKPFKAPKAKADAELVSGTYYTQAGSAFYVYTSSGYQDATTEMTSVEITVDGDQVSIAGLAYWFPEAAVTGTLSGNTLTIPSGQFLGSDEYGDEYLVGSADGSTLSNIIFTFENGVLSSNMFIVESDTAEALNPYCYWAGVAFAMEAPEAPHGGSYEADYFRGQYFADYNGYYCLIEAGDSLQCAVFVNMADGETDLEAGKVYTEADLDLEYTTAVYGGLINLEMSNISFVKTLVDGGYTITLSFEDADGGVWTITATKSESQNVITPAYDETTRTLALTTTNTDTYFFYIESQEEYDKYESDFSQESLVEEINAWIAAMQQEGYLSYFTLSGDMVIDVVKFFGSDAETGDYVALIAPMTADGDINGTATYLQFHFDYPEGVEEVVAAGKAAKIVRDGQLLILKGDKVFNAFGAQLK